MKKQLLLLASVLFCAITFAQSVPQGINYQGVARDAAGVELTNQSLTIQLSVISASATGPVSWQETHSVTTNDFGLFTAVIGQGVNTGGGSSATFDVVDWGSASHYIKVEMNGIDMGTTELMSVPYALQSGNPGPAGADGTNGTNGIDGVDGVDGVDGTNATSLWQDDGNGNATIMSNVGIGTTNPIRGKLEITGNQQCCGTTQGDFWYYLYNNPNGQFQWYNGTDNFDISVYADGRFMGSGIHIFSDERIKNVIGLSNSKKDLSTLLSLEITDYKMKDQAKGNKPYKKVIAQQVMSVYPQAVSLTTEVVPDIYKVSTIDNGYVSLETDLKAGEKVRLILEDETSLFDVISADKNGFKVSTDKSGKVFVYGREVDDFHAVDYESLSMLNVSATQELYKLILSQQKTIESLETEVAELQEIKEDVETLKNLMGIPTKSNTSTMKSE
jgi:hypothetical protein